MKRIINKWTAILLFGIAMQTSNLLAQVSTGLNNGVSSDYVGWDSFQSFPLMIKHEATQPINFYTSAGAGTFLHQRARIFEDIITAPNTATLNVGRVGIQEDGVLWTANPIPASLLHLGQGWPIGAGGHRV